MNRSVDRPRGGGSLGTVDAGTIARIDERGRISVVGAGPDLGWFVAADDRWHDPAREPAVRQSRPGGLPLFETRLRVPSGDVVQRAWAVVSSTAGPLLVVEFENDSAMAVAVALTRRDVTVARPAMLRADSGAWPAPGLDLAERPLVLPLAHRTSIRVALPVRAPTGSGTPPVDPSGLASFESVANGWSTVLDRASRLSVPDLLDTRPIIERITAERCAVVLDPPSPVYLGSDPVAAAEWLLDVREAVRLGVSTAESNEIATAAELVLRDARGRWTPLSAAALRAAAELLVDDARALADLDRAVSGRRRGSLYSHLARHRLVIDERLTRGAFVTAVTESLAAPTGVDEITLVPDGLVGERLGSPIEATCIPVGRGRTVSFAVRWHGANAAVLWEVAPAGRVVVRAGADVTWSSDRPAGEGLWRMHRSTTDTVTTGAASPDQSFS